MDKKLPKSGCRWSSSGGFTLTEVMIAMMILTTAIVSVTSLLVGLISSNRNNLTTLQAYYLAQEGLEAVRNIRDTNWLHNRDWLGGASEQLWGTEFEAGDDGRNYVVNLEYDGFNVPPEKGTVNAGIMGISAFKPWSIGAANSGSGRIFRNIDGANFYLGPQRGLNSADTGFRRVISIKKYNCEDTEIDLPCEDEDMGNYVLVASRVEWNLGAKARELTLLEVLSDWKGGAL